MSKLSLVIQCVWEIGFSLVLMLFVVDDETEQEQWARECHERAQLNLNQ